MTFPVFASGDVLNASDMNAVGLWLVKTQTIGSAVSSVQVTGAFSADYDNYLITITGGAGSANADMTFQLGATTTGYYGHLLYGNYNLNNALGAGHANSASFQFVGAVTTSKLDAMIQIHSPFLTEETNFYSRFATQLTTGINANFAGYLNNTTSYTAFTIAPSSGTLTGGAIKVYGLRN